MPASSKAPPDGVGAPQAKTTGLRQILWLAALLVSFGFIATDSLLRLQRIDRLTTATAYPVREPEADPSSPSGYRAGMHALILPAGATDSCHWILQTEQMFASGESRIRRVGYDNAPAGREIHWASPYRWWIGFLAWTEHVATGQSLPKGIERAALWSNPAMLALALLLATPWIARQFGSWSACAFALGLASMLPTFAYFNSDAPDHHGLACLCAVFTVLFLAAGLFPPPGQEDIKPASTTKPSNAFSSARSCILASGVSGGLGLWVSAASQIPVLVGIGAGALAAAILCRFTKNIKRHDADSHLWQLWAQTGAITSLVGYAIEYLPANAGWRLEVNHPVYALAWLGAGRLLATLNRLVANDHSTTSKYSKLPDALALTAILLPAILVLFGGRAFFRVSDPFLWALHKDYIDEFQNIAHTFKQGFHIVALCSLLPLGLAFVPAALFLKNDSPAMPRSHVALAFAPGLLFAFFALMQIRWLGIASSLLLAGTVYVVSDSVRPRLNRHIRHILVVLCFAAFIGQPIRTCWALLEDKTIGSHDQRDLRIRDLSQWLRFRAGNNRVVVAASPTLTTALIYFGGLQGIGTLYWENIDGLRTCASLFAAPSFEDARRIVEAHRITHIVLTSRDNFVLEAARLMRGNNPSAAASSFGLRLVKNRSLPPWLRLVPYKWPGPENANGEEVLVFEVIPDQTRESALANFTHYFLDMGLPQVARKLLTELEQNRENPPLAIARARTLLTLGDRNGFEIAVKTLSAEPSIIATLSTEESIHLAILLAVAGQINQSQEIMRATLARFDEQAARKLPSSAAYALLALCQQFNLPLPGSTHNLVLTLLAPELRKQFPPQPNPKSARRP